MISVGTLSSLRALRAARSMGRGWSHRMTPVVRVPVASSETVNLALRAKEPPDVAPG